MNYLDLTRNMKKIRIIQKNVKHKKKAKRIIKNMDKINKLSPRYRKDINEYWAQFGVKVNGLWHQIYTTCSGKEDVRYIDEGLFYSKIIGRLNYMNLSEAYDDKCRYNILFPEVKQPKTLVKNINGYFFDTHDNLLNQNQVKEILLDNKKSIFKSSFGPGGGKGVLVLKQDNKDVFMENLNKIFLDKNFIIQEFIQQHSILRELNPTSVNTIRILSFMWKGQIHILASLIRIGDEESEIITADTQCRLIEKDGKLANLGHDTNYTMLKDLSKNTYIPNFERIIQTVKIEHKKIPYFSLIGWDWTIDSDANPILIEINTKWPGFDTKQCLEGPLFGDMTDEVMKYVFEDKKEVLDSIYLGI